MEVRIEEKYGKKVFISVSAEQGRREGCLCIRKENGRTFVCGHLQANMKLENRLKQSVQEAIKNGIVSEERKKHELKRRLKVEAHSAFRDMVLYGGPMIDPKNGICRSALIEFASCVAGNTARATSRCPGYEPGPELTN